MERFLVTSSGDGAAVTTPLFLSLSFLPISTTPAELEPFIGIVYRHGDGARSS